MMNDHKNQNAVLASVTHRYTNFSKNFVANQLLQQIDNNSDSSEANFWFLSAINRYLLNNPEMTLFDFRDVLTEQWPDTSSAFYSCLKDKKELKKAM